MHNLPQHRIAATKNFDFYHSHMSIQKPRRLLLVTTGNLKNNQITELFDKNLKTILIGFKQGDFVELSNTDIITI
jgi:predicted nuclease of predicted toxin-antitoxin system